MNKSRKIAVIVLSWFAVYATMAIIARFSFQNSTESSQTSQGILSLIPFYDKIPAEWLSVIHTLIRKIAHFSVYALLGFTSFNAFHFSVRIKRIFIYLISVGLASSYAIIDEFIYQAITPGRAPMIMDVCIDTCGACFGALLMLLITVIVNIIKNKETSL